MGEQERGKYGTGSEVKNWDKYNPRGNTIKPFKEEYICGLCDSKADVVFPVQVDLCPKCTARVRERKDVFKTISQPFYDFGGRFCVNCGETSIVYYRVNVRICHKCTLRLGKNEIIRNKLNKIARKII